MRQLDQAAIRERGIPSDQLMERAAAALAETAAKCRYLELSGDPFFMDDYVNQMLFE